MHEFIARDGAVGDSRIQITFAVRIETIEKEDIPGGHNDLGGHAIKAIGNIVGKFLYFDICEAAHDAPDGLSHLEELASRLNVSIVWLCEAVVERESRESDEILTSDGRSL